MYLNEHYSKMKRTEKIYEYQMQLINRRWQYFATFLFVNGLLANSIPKEFWSALLAENNLNFQIIVPICISGIILTVIFSQLISKSTYRIDKIEAIIGKENSITGIKLNGQFLGFSSETILLYFATYAFASLWQIFLYQLNKTAFIISLTILIANIFSLKWKALNHNA